MAVVMMMIMLEEKVIYRKICDMNAYAEHNRRKNVIQAIIIISLHESVFGGSSMNPWMLAQETYTHSHTSGLVGGLAWVALFYFFCSPM